MNDFSCIDSYANDQSKQIWLNCDDYNQLLRVQFQYLRNEIKWSPTSSSELKLESSCILQYLLNLTEIHQLFTVRSQSCLATGSTKQREFVIGFGPKLLFTNIIQSGNDNKRMNPYVHLCICDCFANIIYCSHANDMKDCSISVIEHEHLNSETNCKFWIATKVVGGCALLNRFLYALECELNPRMYKFILENCYYITAVDSQFDHKHFLFPLLDQLLTTITNNNENDQDNNSLDDEVVEALRLQNPAQILSNLYLSSAEPAQNLTLLKQLHINSILNLTGYKHNSNSLSLEGPAAGFTPDQIKAALKKTKYDTNEAAILLISNI